MNKTINNAPSNRISAALTLITAGATFKRILKIAAKYLPGTDFQSATELFNETALRFLAGDRNWPQDIKFITCFVGAMRSIADSERKCLKRKPEEIPIEGSFHSPSEQEQSIEKDINTDVYSAEIRLQIEQSRIEAQTKLVMIKGHFSHDSEIMHILIGFKEGMKAAEIQEQSGMDRIRYESALKRLRRGIKKILPLPGEKHFECASIPSRWLECKRYTFESLAQFREESTGIPIFIKGAPGVDLFMGAMCINEKGEIHEIHSLDRWKVSL